MKRTLLLANLALIALVAFSVWLFIKRKADLEAHQALVLNTKPKPGQVIAPISAAPVGAVSPQVYAADTVQRFLFAKDRNPNVVEKPKPKPVEEPMPPLPAAYGLFLLGDSPTIILGMGNSGQRGYHAGDQIGPFKLVNFDQNMVTFNWNGKKVERSLEELASNQAVATPPPVSAAPVPAAAQAGPAAGSRDGESGTQLGEHERACVAGDSTPAGTVGADGYKKITTKTPFGEVCRWVR